MNDPSLNPAPSFSFKTYHPTHEVLLSDGPRFLRCSSISFSICLDLQFFIGEIGRGDRITKIEKTQINNDFSLKKSSMAILFPFFRSDRHNPKIMPHPPSQQLTRLWQDQISESLWPLPHANCHDLDRIFLKHHQRAENQTAFAALSSMPGVPEHFVAA